MLFVYDIAQRKELLTELVKAERLQSCTVHGIKDRDFKYAVRVLLNHKLLIVPSALEHCTPLVERMRTIAIACDIEVSNLTAYCAATLSKNQRPATAAAVPPAQQQAVVGLNP